MYRIGSMFNTRASIQIFTFSIHFRSSLKIEDFPSTNSKVYAYYIAYGFPADSPFNSGNATFATWTKVKVIGDRNIPFTLPRGTPTQTSYVLLYTIHSFARHGWHEPFKAWVLCHWTNWMITLSRSESANIFHDNPWYIIILYYIFTVYMIHENVNWCTLW
jgi:hypothetical protein